MKLNIADIVILKSNPFEDGKFLISGKKIIINVKDTNKGQWVMVDGYNDWIDSTWFKKE